MILKFIKSLFIILFAVLLPTNPVAFGDDIKQRIDGEIYEAGLPICHSGNHNFEKEYQNKAYPTDPTTDIPWSTGMSTVTDIQTAFNNARNIENSQIGTSIPMLSMPSQTTWDGMTDNEKALWLVNRERIDRGIHALHGTETNVVEVAQYYADYLMDNNTTGHTADGSDPWARLNTKSAINSCHDFLSVAENLAYFWTSDSNIAIPLERSIYYWMYVDSSSAWGHRHAILWYPYNDNSGASGMEGFMGIGRASGPHQGWNFAEIVVMNVFDPCANWLYLEEDNYYVPAINNLLLLNSN